MAEICVECLTKIINENPRKRSYVLSKDLHVCAMCGKRKRVILRGRGIMFSIKCRIMERRLKKHK